MTVSSEGRENAQISIHFSTEFNSNEIDVCDLQSEKHPEFEISTVRETTAESREDEENS
jgi:hypothetical protein